MHTYRFYVPPENLNAGEVTLSGTEARHAGRVLRLKPGDGINLFDGEKFEYTARILSVEKKGIVVGEVTRIREASTSVPRLNLYAALVPKFDFIVEKATELGADAVFPLITGQTQVHLKDDAVGEKVERWRRVAISASMQSGRIVLPEIAGPVELSHALRRERTESLGLIASLDETAAPLLSVLQNLESIPRELDLFVGPPADFAEEELADADAEGLVPVKLLSNVLRTETAALAVLAVASAFFYSRQ